MKLRTLLMLLVFILGILAAACDNNDDPSEKQPTIRPINVAGFNVSKCKSDLLESDSSVDDEDYGKEYVVITPSSTPGEITITHVNVWFTCDSKIEVHATLDTEKNMITLTEAEVGESLADCECMFDVTTEMTGVEKGDYYLILTRSSSVVEISIKDEPAKYEVHLRK